MIRDERGFTLPELLVAMAVMVIVLLGTLALFDGTQRNQARNSAQNDAVERSRVTIDQVVRQLRNLANPTSAGTTIQTAQAYDAIFQTSDPSKTWVRYCLKTTGTGAATTGTLYYAITPDALTASEQAACPGTGWPTPPKTVATNAMNQYAGADRPLFSYSCATPLAPTQACPIGDNSKITFVGLDLYVDIDPTRAPAERRVSSGVYLRNQNEPPTVSFTAVYSAATKTILLNASASDDPEGRTLHYYWWKGPGTIGTAMTDPCLPAVTPSAKYLGEGVTLTYRVAPTDTSPVPITLVVKDPGCLSASSTQNVVIN
jgi:prepilin-type N-terminal cleavage/methylation domain-containing protein